MACFLLPLSLIAQPAVEDFKDIFRLQAKETTDPVKVDGQLDDAAWQLASRGTDFWLKVPYFAEGADPKTEVMLSYDDTYLYVAAKCHQKEDILVQSLIRDQYWDNDGIAILLDPLNTRTNGFLFGTTAAGAQWDALRSLDEVNPDWSNKWYSDTYRGEDYWSMEMAIPWRILRFDGEATEWGMNFVRNHMNENEYHNWTAVPESFWPIDPGFTGALVFDKAPTPPKANYNLIPYVTSTVSKITENPTQLSGNIGLDARMSVTPTLNLDLTVNPDFSQIEVDQLVTNLTRFNIFLPERRTFFLENADLFADYGYGTVRPFFSRRIGLDADRQTVPIIAGARLTGNVTNATRIGVMNVHSGASDNTPAQNQTAVAAQHLIGRSFIKGIFLNRQSYDGWEQLRDDYGRNLGLEAGYVSDDGQITVLGGAHRSFQPATSSKTGFYSTGFNFTNPNWNIGLSGGHVQENYRAEMGFVARLDNYDAERDTTIRVGFYEVNGNITYRYRPRKGIVTRHNYTASSSVFLNPDGSLNERQHTLGYSALYNSTATSSLSLNTQEVQLLYPFRFVSDAIPLPADNYRYSFVQASFNSDERKPISWGMGGRTGGFYNGSLHQANAGLNFRVQPWVNWSLGYEWNRLDFPDQYGQETITALLSTVEVGFTRDLFWTTLFQYLDQAEYLGLNSRLQWRFAPMSDLFLVYVDNYDVVRDFGRRSPQTNNRALILKVNYWY